MHIKTSDQIIYNAIQTPDSTIIVSRHRHDYVTHKDAVTGKVYEVDGGLAYLRRSVHDDQVELSQYYRPDDHEHNARWLCWGTRGKDGKSPLTYNPICAMDTDHIERVVKMDTAFPSVLPLIRSVMEKELERRKGLTVNI